MFQPGLSFGKQAQVTGWGLCMQDTKAAGVQVYSYDEFLALGKQHPAEPVPPKPEDLCTIMYTSGTTGDPKVGPHSMPMHHACHTVQAVARGRVCWFCWVDAGHASACTVGLKCHLSDAHPQQPVFVRLHTHCGSL